MIVKEKVALVTGSRGIGSACASLLAERGASVIVAFKQNQEAAEHLVAAITKNGGIAQAYQTDVLDTVQIAHLVSTIRQRYNRLDIVVSNAAVGWQEKPLAQL